MHILIDNDEGNSVECRDMESFVLLCTDRSGNMSIFTGGCDISDLSLYSHVLQLQVLAILRDSMSDTAAEQEDE